MTAACQLEQESLVALLPKLLSGELRLFSQGFGTAAVPAAADKLVEKIG